MFRRWSMVGITTLAMVSSVGLTAWGQGKERGGKGEGGGGGRGGVSARGSGSAGARGGGGEVRGGGQVRGQARSGGRSEQQATRQAGQANRQGQVKGDARTETRRETVRSEPRQESRRETVRSDSRRDSNRDLERGEISRRDGIEARHRDRDRDRDRDWHRRHWRDFDDDDFSIGLSVGPFSAFYGRPWFGYGGPWGGYYGPHYGYYGTWSGFYGSGWPYYYGDYNSFGIYDSDTRAAYYDPEIMTDVPQSQSRSEMRSQTNMTTQEGLDFQRRAEVAFRNGNYDQAARLANHAAVEMPRDGKLFLFISQALFAVGDYMAAAGAAHQGMAMSDPQDWGIIVKNYRQYYSDVNAYTEQLRRLEKFAAENDDAAFARFLLGYHYGFLGYPTEARRELELALEMENRDQLAAKLLEEFGGEAPRDIRRSNRDSEQMEGDRIEQPQDDRTREETRTRTTPQPLDSDSQDETESRDRE